MSNQITRHEEDVNSILFFARNEYYVGNFIGSINSVLPGQETATEQLLAYMYLSYIAMDSGSIVTLDIKQNNSTALLAVRYIQEAIDSTERSEDILAILTDKLVTEEDEFNIWHVAIAIVYCNIGQFENALRILNKSNSLESMAFTVQCLLHMSRTDLAKQIVVRMQEISDDDTLTQLAQAWIAINLGTEQMQDAFHIYQELCEKSKTNLILLNALVALHLGLERYEEADTTLREALSKKYNDYNTLINSIVLSHLSGKTQGHTARSIEQLKQSYPKSEVVKSIDRKTAEFDELCLHYAATNKTESEKK